MTKVFNFGHPLSQSAITKIEQYFGQVQHIKVGVQLNVFDADAPGIEQQVLDVVRPYATDFNGAERMVIISPGMSNAAWVLAAIIHGLSGRFPELVELRLNSDKVFDFYRVIDLQEFRNEVRKIR
jgi:hypothetical protein